MWVDSNVQEVRLAAYKLQLVVRSMWIKVPAHGCLFILRINATHKEWWRYSRVDRSSDIGICWWWREIGRPRLILEYFYARCVYGWCILVIGLLAFCLDIVSLSNETFRAQRQTHTADSHAIQASIFESFPPESFHYQSNAYSRCLGSTRFLEILQKCQNYFENVPSRTVYFHTTYIPNETAYWNSVIFIYPNDLCIVSI